MLVIMPFQGRCALLVIFSMCFANCVHSHRAIPCAGDYALSGQVCFVGDIFNVLCKLCA